MRKKIFIYKFVDHNEKRIIKICVNVYCSETKEWDQNNEDKEGFLEWLKMAASRDWDLGKKVEQYIKKYHAAPLNEYKLIKQFDNMKHASLNIDPNRNGGRFRELYSEMECKMVYSKGEKTERHHDKYDKYDKRTIISNMLDQGTNDEIVLIQAQNDFEIPSHAKSSSGSLSGRFNRSASALEYSGPNRSNGPSRSAPRYSSTFSGNPNDPVGSSLRRFDTFSGNSNGSDRPGFSSLNSSRSGYSDLNSSRPISGYTDRDILPNNSLLNRASGNLMSTEIQAQEGGRDHDREYQDRYHKYKSKYLDSKDRERRESKRRDRRDRREQEW